MVNTKENADFSKPFNQPGDYYFCSLCAAWHRCTNDPSSTGNQHLSYLDENETNSPTSKYFFCSLCGKWHTDARKDHLQYRLHIQHFSRKNGISFIVKGLKIGEIKLGSGGFVLTLIQNILNKGYTSVHQVKKDFVFADSGKTPISDTDLRNHFISEAKNLIELRKNNTIGYREKWLHSLLIEKMQDGSLSGLDLEFLYYETPVGKVKRNKQFGREHIDILVKERRSKALIVVEVKKEGEDLNSAVSQGLSYIAWLAKYKEYLKPRIAQLGWDVDIENLELIVIAPDTAFKNTSLDANIMKQSKRLNCEVIAAYLNPNYVKNENVSKGD